MASQSTAMEIVSITNSDLTSVEKKGKLKSGNDSWDKSNLHIKITFAVAYF